MSETELDLPKNIWLLIITGIDADEKEHKLIRAYTDMPSYDQICRREEDFKHFAKCEISDRFMEPVALDADEIWMG